METRSIKELIDLSGRTAIVTGSTGGFGLHISKTIAELGADLILLDKPNSSFEKIDNQIRQISPEINIITLECDLEDESSRSESIEMIKSESKNLSILINNAAFGGGTDLPGWTSTYDKQSLGTWRRAIEVNLTSIFHFSRDLAPELKKAGNASIINIASIYGFLGPDWSLYEDTEMGNPAAYSASKGGLIQLTKWLSTTLAPDIRVNAISPGGINRELPEPFVEKYELRTPLRRMGTDEDIKGVIAFLSSDLSQYVTGQNIVMDGGWSVW